MNKQTESIEIIKLDLGQFDRNNLHRKERLTDGPKNLYQPRLIVPSRRNRGAASELNYVTARRPSKRTQVEPSANKIFAHIK